jgi:SAM-dependent methyltransferase
MTFHKSLGLLGIAASFLALSAVDTGAQPYPGEGGVNLDVPYVPTAQAVVNRMLEMAQTNSEDIHYDLGSGDGRIVVTAARDFKVKKGVGVDIDPVRIEEANANARNANVTDRVTFHNTDLFNFDFTEATVLTLYLLPDVNIKLRPAILNMKPGTRVVSHAFTMGEWRPDNQDTIEGEALYYWMVPAKISGAWEWTIGQDNYRIDLTQQYQVITGTLHGPNGQSQLLNTVLKGEDFRFGASVPRGGLPVTMHFVGKITDDKLVGTIDFAGQQSTQITATRTK